MRYGSVCSGIEAASVAWHPLGWEAAWLAEIEPFPKAVLGHQYPSVPNYGDMTALADRVNSLEIEAPDVLVGGTPCQAFSVAGLRQSLDDDRGQLTIKFLELADAIDTVRRNRGEPECLIVWENVPGVLSTKDNAFGCFLAGIAGESEPLQPAGKRWSDAGCVFGPTRTVAWRVLDAQYFGLAQRRRRVFVVASARDGFDPAAVLFEFDGVRRDTAPSREAGKVAIPTTAGCSNGGGLGTDFDGGVIQQSIAFEPGFLKREGTHFYHEHTGTIRSDPGDNAMAVASLPVIAIQNATRGKSQNGLGVSDAGDPMYTLDQASQHAVAFHENQRGEITVNDTAGSLKAGGGKPGQGYPAVAVAIQGTLIGRSENAGPQGSGADISGAMFTLTKTDVHAVAVAMRESGQGYWMEDTVSGTLRAEGENRPSRPSNVIAQPSMQVRRLTPVECERLQGFPDGYTLIPWRKKPADECPDGPRYKALGNSMAVPVMAWIGKRIEHNIQSTWIGETTPAILG